MSAAGSLTRAAGCFAVVCFAVVFLFLNCRCSKQPAQPPPTAQYVDALNVGAGWMGQFEFTKAEQAFASAVAMDPANPYGRLDEAIAVLNQTSTDAQDRAIALFAPLLDDALVGQRATYCTGLAQLFLGRPADALPYFRACAQANPADAHAAYYTAQTLELTGEIEQALPWYERAEQLDPFLRSAVLGLQRVYARLGQDEKSTQMLALFDRLANNPRSSLAEFKYTRMGGLGEVLLPQLSASGAFIPTGPIFAPAQLMTVAQWPSGATPGGCQSSVDLNGDGRTDLIWRALGKVDSIIPIIAPSTAGVTSWQALPDHPLARIADLRQLFWGDLNNDGRVDAVVTRSGVVVEDSRTPGTTEWYEQTATGEWLVRSFGESVAPDANVLALADFDHDGDVDVLIAQRTPNQENQLRICYNRLDGTWQSVDLPLDSTQSRAVTSAVLLDVDRDGDLDIIAVMKGLGASRSAVLVNDRLWSWSRNSNKYAAFESHRIMDAVAFARNEDGVPMVAALQYNSYQGGAPCSHLVVWAFEETGPRQGRESYYGLANWIAVVDATGTGHQNILIGGTFRNRIFSSLRDNVASVMMYDSTGEPIEEITYPTSDRFDTPTPIILAGTGLVLLNHDFHMQGAGPGRAPIATIDFRGRIDPAQQMRTNSSGIGTTAVARIGGEWVTARQLPWNTASGQSTDPCVIGLGSAKKIDFLTIHWPDRVMQTQIDLPPTAQQIVETQRQISSCPVIFAWNGTSMAFQTDSLGVAGLGYLATVAQSPSGKIEPVYAPPRSSERVRLLDDTVAARNGFFEIVLAEPMEEFTALDCARLSVYDLAPEWNLALDERMGINGPQPTGAPIFWRGAQLPTVVQSSHGDAHAIDQTDAALRRDFVAVDPGPIDPRFIGRTTDPWTLEISFANPIASGTSDPVLLMDGWVEYPYCQTNFAMWQANAALLAPSFEARDPATGEWNMVVKEYGYPAGMPREAAFPLDRASLPPGCRQLRITSNQEIYIDRLRIVQPEQDASVSVQTIDPSSARVRDGGFARRIAHPQRRPDYDYERAVPLWDCVKQSGWYTTTARDCLPLVAEPDDAVALFAAGEEIRLAFPDQLKPLPTGWRRVFVLDLHGWCKDRDFLTKDGDRIEPLPRLRNSPDETAARQRLHDEFNTRYEAGP